MDGATDQQTKAMWLLEAKYILHREVPTNQASLEKFKVLFGTSIDVCEHLWNDISVQVRQVPGYQMYQKQHFLWGLYWLRHYPSDRMNALACGCDRKTVVKWTGITVRHIAGRLPAVVSLYFFIFKIISSLFSRPYDLKDQV